MRKALRALLLIIILITGLSTAMGFMEEKEDNSIYEEAKQYIKNEGPDPTDLVIFPTDDNADSLSEVYKYQMKYDWDSLLPLNDDICGWLYIPNNDVINFPVVHGSNNTFYLNRDYTGKYNGNGSAFIDYRYNLSCISKLIHGHNMNLTPAKPVFTTIINWKDKEYFDSHRTLYYTTANGLTKEYLIVGIAHFNVRAKEEYSYLEMEFDTEERFRGWVEYIKEHSTYFDLGDNEIEYKQDEIIILSTCDRKLGYEGNGRTILFCVNLTNNIIDW